jgi:hypothetical protein
MIYKTFIVIGLLTTLCAVAYAVPKEYYGKSVAVV